MNESWNSKQLLSLIVGLFAFQLGILWALDHGRKSDPPTPRETPIRISWVNGRQATGLYNDPAAFVLASRNGFSGSTWQVDPSVAFQVPEWVEPPRWLGFEPSTSFLPQTPVSQNFFEGPMVAEKPAPSEGLEFSYPSPIPEPSRLKIESGFKNSDLLAVPDLRTWKSKDPLTNTVVRLGVIPSGDVFSVQLVNRSGLVDADNHALQISRQLRFRPWNGPLNEIRWGTVQVEWLTLPESTIGP